MEVVSLENRKDGMKKGMEERGKQGRKERTTDTRNWGEGRREGRDARKEESTEGTQWE